MVEKTMERYKAPILTCLIIERVRDYNERDRLEKTPGRAVLVDYSDLIYRVIGEKWNCIGKVKNDGRIIIRGIDYERRAFVA